MVKLGVNIDHIATIRQARRALDPDPVVAAAISEAAGADGITVHLREDRRHIQDRDVVNLRRTVNTKLNLEMAAAPEILEIALRIKPDDVCLVPEKRRELTTEGGLDAAGQKGHVRGVVGALRKAGIRVNLFIDPDERQVSAAKETGADGIELHTGAYAERFAVGPSAADDELRRLVSAAGLAGRLGLTVNAGHGLDYRNVARVLALPGLYELNIGFAIVARAAFVGLDRAVREMKSILAGTTAVDDSCPIGGADRIFYIQG